MTGLYVGAPEGVVGIVQYVDGYEEGRSFRDRDLVKIELVKD